MTNKQLKKEEQNVATQVQKFVADSIMFYQKCKKPDYTEYMKILQACIMGFFIMGAIGYFIKLVFIPINNIILSWMKAIFCAKVKKMFTTFENNSVPLIHTYFTQILYHI